ncbi:M16 family metallopeptidase [Bacteroidota bacterium]
MKVNCFYQKLALLLIVGNLFFVSYSQAYTNVKEIKLENGFTVLLNEDHAKPEVFGLIVVKAGAKNDPEDATGMAHYQEHMLFKGTTQIGTLNWEKEKPLTDSIFSLYDALGKTDDEEKRKGIQEKINDLSVRATEYIIPNEFENLIKSIGGRNINAGTGPDYTMFYSIFPSNQIEKWLTINCEQFKDPVFRSFQAELEIVYEEKNMYSDMFFNELLEQFEKHMFENHPYGLNDMIGTVDDLKNPSLTKMYEFYKTHYVANNMALVLSGSFNGEEVIPLIEKTFGTISPGEIQATKKYEAIPYNGRKLVEVKLSPIKIGLLGFQTVPKGHKDEIKIKICNNILTNTGKTGLIDQLTLENKILESFVTELPYQDLGANVIIFIPKIVGQKLEEAEQLIFEKINKLREGDFSDSIVIGIKNQLYTDFQLKMESSEERAIFIAEAFSQGKDMNEIFNYPTHIKNITKEEVIEAANKYFNDNYLAYFSSTGFPKKEKVDKPGYKPVISNTNAKSEFALKLNETKSIPNNSRFYNFNKDVTHSKIKDGVELFYNINSNNDIYSLRFRYGAGNQTNDMLEYATYVVNYAGTEKFEASKLKKEMAYFGADYSIYSDDSYLYYEFNGLEENIEDVFSYVNQIINHPNIQNDQLNIIYEGVKADRKMEDSEPDLVADALFEYAKYKQKSRFLDRLNMEEINEITADTLNSTLNIINDYEVDIFYTGKMSPDKITELINSNIDFDINYKLSESPFELQRTNYEKNTIYFVNDKKALQSKMYFYLNSSAYNHDNQFDVNAFNMYFGGGFTGLAYQEIREFRSLAYAVDAKYKIPQVEERNSYFMGYVGTQADKTLEALEVFYGLINEMPEKPERIELIKSYLQQTVLLEKRPDNRELAETILDWKLLGYNEDPAIKLLEDYNNLEFENIMNFYNNEVKNKLIVISIVGNKKEFDFDALTKYGTIVEMNKKELYRK